MRGDYPEVISAEGWEAVRVLWGERLEKLIADEDDIKRSIGQIVSRNKRLILLAAKESASMPSWEKFCYSSWHKTNSSNKKELKQKLLGWLVDNQSDIHIPGRQMHVMSGEVTPDARMIMKSFLFMGCNGDIHRDTEHAAKVTREVLMSGLTIDWKDLKLNVLTHDFVCPRIVREVVKRNFTGSDDSLKMFDMCFPALEEDHSCHC
eukprot:TRINITY_DN58336_c0_g1_i2.p1 TRINITY_DN58336_c0_g1~~TRINITY_DN58336_c0_g1_i2.p1  ORF type:complete len:206 (-),score=21.57 TRINITY_DN58336_c0_g1_i2:68-685(-)